MCGICGFIGKPQPEATGLLRAMNDAQAHRGPDAEGAWISSDQRVGLAHRRLSIIDLTAAGSQPMLSHSGRYRITFNGEIYNFRELRAELSQQGHRFRGTSDTEVLLAACDEWGVVEAVPKLSGMFAAVIWDEADRVAYLFRDRLGVKPLYYQWHDGTLFFSSELTAAFAQVSGATPTVSRDALSLLLRHGYVPGPHSIYEQIRKLPPGAIATLSLDNPSGEFASFEQYWDTTAEVGRGLARSDRETTPAESLALLDETLRASIRDHMISDVPLGAFLSGGIDSSLIVAYMQQVSNAQVRTFTIGFEEDKFSEAPCARRVAQYLGTEHTELTIREEDALQVVPRLAEIYGEPFADSSQIPTYLVSQLAREHVTVAISGDGGDELFAGYNAYQTMVKRGHLLRFVPKSCLPVLRAAAQSRAPLKVVRSMIGGRHFSRLLTALRMLSLQHRSHLVPPSMAQMSLAEQLVQGTTPGVSVPTTHNFPGTLVERLMCVDLATYLPDDILVKVDRASMAVSLEVRAPFADDYRVFEAAWKIPFAHKIQGKQSKMVLRRLLRRFVPAELVDRPKSGFAVPLVKWLSGALREWVQDCVSPVRLRHEGYFVPKRVEDVRQRAFAGDLYYASMLWSICQFQAWLHASAVPHSRPETLRVPYLTPLMMKTGSSG